MRRQQWTGTRWKAVPETKARPTGKPKPARRRRRRPSPITALWGVISASMVLTFVITEALIWGVIGLVSIVVGTISAFGDFVDNGPVPGPPPRSPGKPIPRGNGVRGPRAPAAGGPRKPSGRPRKRVCSTRCRASTQPKSTCRCSCGGNTHGIGAGSGSRSGSSSNPNGWVDFDSGNYGSDSGGSSDSGSSGGGGGGD